MQEEGFSTLKRRQRKSELFLSTKQQCNKVRMDKRLGRLVEGDIADTALELKFPSLGDHANDET